MVDFPLKKQFKNVNFDTATAKLLQSKFEVMPQLPFWNQLLSQIPLKQLFFLGSHSTLTLPEHRNRSSCRNFQKYSPLLFCMRS